MIRELRSRLQEQLPGYMVPSALMVLESLPLTANGKVDRKALPAPEASVSGSEYVPPEGVTEELLAALWSVLLKCERVGRHDNFFELGGHSLLATQLASRIREAFSTELSVREVFEHPTLCLQARAIERSRGTGALSTLRWRRCHEMSRYRCRMHSNGCGFCSSTWGRTRSTTCRWRCGCAERWMRRRWCEAWRSCTGATSRCARALRGDGSAVQVIDPAGLELKVEAVSAAGGARDCAGGTLLLLRSIERAAVPDSIAARDRQRHSGCERLRAAGDNAPQCVGRLVAGDFLP